MADAAYREILAAQRAWAEATRTDLDDDGHVRSWPDNLLAPPCARTRSELEARPARPFGEPGKPGPLHLLHSSLALAVSTFDYWRERDASPLVAALDLPGPVTDIRFVPAPEGIERDARQAADLIIECGGARPVAVLARYAEPYTDVDPRLPATLRDGEDAFGDLHGCRALARDLRVSPGRYQRLEAGRLLACVTALSHTYGPRGFRLEVLWHELPHAAARELRRELSRVRARIGGEVDVRSRTWADLVDRLARNRSEHVTYTRYLQSRYLGRS